MTEREMLDALDKLDAQAAALVAEVAAINKSLAEAVELLKQAPVLRAQVQGMPQGLPIIGGGR